MPISHSAVQHRAADNNPFLPTKAYDYGADFYLFNRCTIYEIVEGEKYSLPGDETPRGCTLANPADAFKLSAFAEGGASPSPVVEQPDSAAPQIAAEKTPQTSASVAVQSAAESAAAVTIVRPALRRVDPDLSVPVGPAKVCATVANARRCYTPPSSEPPFGLDPKAVDVTLAPGNNAVVFTATAFAGGSGASTFVALLVPRDGGLVDILPASCTVSAGLSQYQFWNAPAISSMALFITANFVWHYPEPHYGAHHYQVSIYAFDARKGIYVLQTEYVTTAKYGTDEQPNPPSDLLQREQPQIIAKLLRNR